MFWHGRCEQVRVSFLIRMAEVRRKPHLPFSFHQMVRRQTVKLSKAALQHATKTGGQLDERPGPSNDGSTDKDFFELCPAFGTRCW